MPKLHFIQQPSCKKCGTELISDRAEYCPDCLRRQRSFESGVALIRYDTEIRGLVQKEEHVGLKTVTDGEYRRSFWHMDFLWGLTGTQKVKSEHFSVAFKGFQPKAETVRIVDKLDFPEDHPFLKHFRFLKSITEEQMAALISAMDGKPGDLLLFAADKNKVVWDVLGNLRLEIARQLDLLKKDDYKFLWVTEFPLLEYSEEQGRFVAMHHPFTMPMDEDWHLIDSNPGAVRAKAYDIVLNGTEIGGGSVRIHQSDIQSKMFEVLGFTPEKAQEQFGFLLEAFKYGVPPHAGLAYGLDRVVMLMGGCDSIREVIAFPKVKDASCLMTEAPTPVDPKQLEELGIEVCEETETTEE